MGQAQLLEEEMNEHPPQEKRRGPPNRMNDLAYKEWMKFQKSFFWWESGAAFAKECIHFFTKSVWPDASPSRSLIVGVEGFVQDLIAAPRVIDVKQPETIDELIKTLAVAGTADHLYDFALVDLRHWINNQESLTRFVCDYSEEFFKAVRELLVDERYCGLLVGTEQAGGGGFPLPWSVAMSGRSHLRLRDEKVGLNQADGSVTYCIFMQAADDERSRILLLPGEVHVATLSSAIPAWTIPKPPPRKKNEVLHPAKYPETLVSEFIGLFTEPGDNVFDPMVGTGSTVVAALEMNRNGYGLDLVADFVDIARERVSSKYQPTLFTDMEPDAKVVIAEGDATNLGAVDVFRSIQFDYVSTSPPYWSMLSNPGSENQRSRREKNLRLVYSDDERDLGNVGDYDKFLDLLTTVYNEVANKLVDNGQLTVVVKNVKRNHILYTLAWDLVARLSGPMGKYNYLGTTLWCQDDIGLKPFAVGIHWVSNIVHNYCLHFMKRGTM